MACNQELREQGKPYPRTCRDCGLGRCKRPSYQDLRAEIERLTKERDYKQTVIEKLSDHIEKVEAERDQAVAAAYEAVPVAWAYYWPDGGMMNVLLTSDAPHEGLRQVPLYAHPPQPSETVAELVGWWERQLEDVQNYPAPMFAEKIKQTVAALRALKGETE